MTPRRIPWPILAPLAAVLAFVWLARGRDHDGETPEAPPVVGGADVDLTGRTAAARSGVPRPPRFRVTPSRARRGPAAALLSACQEGRRCPEGTECGPAPDGEIGCYASNCRSEQDRSCGDGRRCWRVPVGGGRALHRCGPGGLAAAGAPCDDGYPATPDRSCAAGLICRLGTCRQGCAADRPCAEGERCMAPSGGEGFCLAAQAICRADGDCAVTELCLRPPGRLKGICTPLGIHANGTPGCRPGSCPAGAICEGTLVDGAFLGHCRRACDDERFCGAGDTCAANAFGFEAATGAQGRACRRTCTIGGLTTACAAGETCISAAPGEHTRGVCVAGPASKRTGYDETLAREVWGGPDRWPAPAEARP